MAGEISPLGAFSSLSKVGGADVGEEEGKFGSNDHEVTGRKERRRGSGGIHPGSLCPGGRTLHSGLPMWIVRVHDKQTLEGNAKKKTA